MTSEELQRLLSLSGVACRGRGDEVLVATCVFCGNEKFNLELNAEKGVYHAWCCHSGGRLDVLLKALAGLDVQLPVRREAPKAKPAAGPPAAFKSLAIVDVPSAAAYLEGRGIDAFTAASYGLRVCVEVGHPLEGRIAVPALDFWDGRVVGWSGRSYTGRFPKYMSTMTRSQVTGWRRIGNGVPCVVVEGHFDGIAAHRAGYSVAVMGGVHAADLEAWGARLPPMVRVLVMLDGDAAAEAERLYWQLAALRGEAGLRLVRLGEGEDPAGIGPVGVRAAIGKVD